MVEQRIENPRVGGSIPPLATIKSMTSVAYAPLGIRSQFAACGFLPHERGQMLAERNGVAALKGVAVHGQGDRRVRMAEPARDRHHVCTRSDRQRGVRTPGIVNADRPQARAAQCCDLRIDFRSR